MLRYVSYSTLCCGMLCCERMFCNITQRYAMFCYVASAILCSGVTLRFATLRYLCYAMLFYVTLRYLCFVTLVTLRLLCYVTFGYLHCIALRYAMAGCCVMVCDVTSRYAILRYRYLCCVFACSRLK